MRSAFDRDFPGDAASWDARLRSSDCSDQERVAFKAWRQASVDNRREYDRLQTLLSDLRASRHAPEVRSLREWAADSSKFGPGFRLSRRYRTWAAAAAVVAFLAAIPWLASLRSGDPVQWGESAASALTTAIGERSTFSLDDGTTIVLNTNTRLMLDFSANERRVALHQGQALFDVAEDPDSPFVVIAGSQRIVAIGTVFDVRFEGADVNVTLVEGLLDIAPEEEGTQGGGPPVRLVAGQRLTTDAGKATAPPVIESVDTQRATIWQTGRVFFEDTPLSYAIDEMNRYSTLKIALDDESLADIRVSGMFQSGRQANFASALEEYFPITAVRLGGNLIVLRAN